MPSNSKVDGIVLLIGVNGAGYESNKSHVKALINKLSARYPNKTMWAGLLKVQILIHLIKRYQV